MSMLTSLQARKITKEEREATVTQVLRKALTDGKLWGMREKRAKVSRDAACHCVGSPGMWLNVWHVGMLCMRMV